MATTDGCGLGLRIASIGDDGEIRDSVSLALLLVASVVCVFLVVSAFKLQLNDT